MKNPFIAFTAPDTILFAASNFSLNAFFIPSRIPTTVFLAPSKCVVKNDFISDSLPSVATFIALRAPVTTPFIALSGARARELKTPNAPENMLFNPSRACDQFPVNTPCTKSITP